mgnify:CR=1 FL=1
MRGVLIYLVASMALFGCGQDREARQQQSSKPEIQVIETAGRKTSDGLIAYTGASLWDGTGDPIIQGSTLIVEEHVHVQLVMFMLMKNGLTNYKKKKMQNKICSIWLLNRKNLVD